ncbi:hypothetical protein BN182_3480004 [Clostridioides difficile E9]|nr:hypothetical protein BN182_3480004 [Clostridioides difficile E9]
MPGTGGNTHFRGRSRFQSLSESGMGGSDGDLQERQVEADIQPGNGAPFKGTPAGLHAGGHQGRYDTGFP